LSNKRRNISSEFKKTLKKLHDGDTEEERMLFLLQLGDKLVDLPSITKHIVENKTKFTEALILA
jgi:hypothetical protein